MNEIQRENRRLTRKDFIVKGSVALASAVFADELALLSRAADLLASSEKLTPTELLKLPPNQNLPAVGFSIVPDSLATHYWNEPLIIAMNYSDLDIGIYGEGFKQARGLRTLKIEQFPQDKKFKDDKAKYQEWESYITQVISKYKGITRAIIGNECNPKKLKSYMPPEEYATIYETAYQVIKAFSPQTIVSLYGEAYDGNESRSHLKQVLRILKTQGLRPDEGSTHFYDHPRKLKGWLEGYQNTLNEFFGHIPIQVSEMGKQISIPVSDEQQAALMVQDLALAAAYVEQGRINFAAWFTAATFNQDQSHALFRFSKTVNGKLEASNLVTPWLLVTKALHHDVRLMEARGITIVSGRNADNQSSLVVWNKTSQPLPCQIPVNRSAYDLYGKEIPTQNGLVLLPPTKYSGICFGNPVFFF